MLECYTQRFPLAKKWHKCDLCDGVIPPGEKYYRFSGVDSGAFFDQKYHLSCKNILEAYTLSNGDFDEIDFWSVEDWVRERVCSDCEKIQGCKTRVFACEKVIKTYSD